MTRRQRLSNLSVAALALLAASSFAQAQSSHDESTPVAINVAEPTVALNRERATVKPLFTSEEMTPSGNVTIATNRPRLSMEMFKLSPSKFTDADSQRFNGQTTIYYRAEYTKNQFSVDDYAGPAPRPRTSFISSRGPKLPDQADPSRRD